MRAKAIASVMLALSATASFAAEPKFRNASDLVAAVMPSFVNVYNRGVVSDPAGGAPRIQDEVGSGMIIDPNGLILTNRHVIEGAYALFVTLTDGTRVPAKLVGKVLNFDLALIRIEVGRPLQPVRFGDSAKLRRGDRVVAIGNPLGFDNSVSAGVISAFNRQIGLSNYDDLMQTDATINRGNSGGPLFNMDGEVIGVNQAIYTQNKGGSIGIGFSIPINEAKAILANIRQYGKPRIGWLGVSGQTFTAGMARVTGIPLERGVIISDVVKNGAAAEAGLQVGDIIVKVGNSVIDRMAGLNRAIALSADKVEQFQIVRDGKPMTIAVKLKEYPQDVWSPAMPAPPKINSFADLGITFAAQPGPNGPVVESVVEQSIAWTEGVRAGDIVRRFGSADVRTTEDLMKLVQEARGVGKEGALILVTGPNGARWMEFSAKE